MRQLLILLVAATAIFACGRKKADIKIADEKTLFEQAQNFEKAEDFAKASETYQLLADTYPQSQSRYKALFMLGYIQLEYLKDHKKAEKTFKALLTEYPSCDLADDAKFLYTAASSGKTLDDVFQDSLKTK